MSVMSASGLDEGDVNPGASRWSAPTAGPTLPAIVNAIAGTSAAAAAAAIALRAMSASLPPRPPSRPSPRRPLVAGRSRGVREDRAQGLHCHRKMARRDYSEGGEDRTKSFVRLRRGGVTRVTAAG